MIKSKAKIENQLKRKTNRDLIQTVVLAKKNSAWLEVASALTFPSNKLKGVNLSELDKAKAKVIAVCGKVLSQGEVTKKFKVAALKFSKNAEKKLKDAGCEISLLSEEILNNKDAKDVKILK